jgi:hypothetical protein
MDLSSIDPTGDGTAFPTPYPKNVNGTVYNGSKGCEACGILLNPVQALNSDMCPSCNKRQAVNRVSNKMVGQ